MIHHYFNLYGTKIYQKETIQCNIKYTGSFDFSYSLMIYDQRDCFFCNCFFFCISYGRKWNFYVVRLLGIHFDFYTYWMQLFYYFFSGKKINLFSELENRILKILIFVPAIYGAFAFFKRGLIKYMFLRTHFGLFDFDKPVLCFFAGYVMKVKIEFFKVAALR